MLKMVMFRTGSLMKVIVSISILQLLRTAQAFSSSQVRPALVKARALYSSAPKSFADHFSDQLKSLLLTTVCVASTVVMSMPATAVWARDANYEPYVQGILDVSDKSIIPAVGDSFLVKVFDKSTDTLPELLAGAKLPFSKALNIPFHFQLFKENLMTSQTTWDKLGDFDQRVEVTLCRGAVAKGGFCEGETVAIGEGVSKVVTIGSEKTEVRGVRLFAFVKLKALVG